MSNFPLIGKNVLVIHGDIKTKYNDLYVSDGILLSYDALINEKKESILSVKLNTNGVDQSIEGVLLITLYSTNLQEVNAKKLKEEEDFKEQQGKYDNSVQTSKTPKKCILSIKDIKTYLQSTDTPDKGLIVIYVLDEKLNVKPYIEPGKFFKLLSLNIDLTEATIQTFLFDKEKAKTTKPEIKPIENIFSIFNPIDLTPQTAGKKYFKKHSKKYFKNHSKKHSKKYSKKHSKKHTKRRK
jgi:hypothetical protein